MKPVYASDYNVLGLLVGLCAEGLSTLGGRVLLHRALRAFLEAEGAKGWAGEHVLFGTFEDLDVAVDEADRSGVLNVEREGLRFRIAAKDARRLTTRWGVNEALTKSFAEAYQRVKQGS
jgi:hypothetical protein